MKLRIISGAILLLVMLYVVIWAPFYIFYGFFAITAILSVWEYRNLIYNPDPDANSKPGIKYKPFFIALIALGTFIPFLLILIAYIGKNNIASSEITNLNFSTYADKFLFYCIITWFFSLSIYRKTLNFAKLIQPWLIAINLTFVNGGFFFAIFSLRYLDPISYHLDFNSSPLIFIYVILLVVATDSGAYFTGKLFGKHKLSPIISPNKTIEGLIGGLVCATILAFLFLYFGKFPGTETIKLKISFIIVSIVIVLFSVHGDLFESFLKRRAQIKDSSNLIPGHGGVLDRLDSLQAAFAFMCYYWYFVVLDYAFHAVANS